MDFNWSFFLTIAVTITSIISVVVILKYTGGLDIVIQLLRWLVDFFRQSVDWVVNNSPRPIRMLLVLFLIISIGAGIYAVSFGATKVCFEDQVYSVPWYEGMVFKLNPDALFTEAETAQQLENFVWYNGSPVENYQPQQHKSLGEHNFFVWNTYYQGGIPYTVLEILDPGNNLRERDYGLIAHRRPRELFRELFGGQYVRYDICLAPARSDYANTCVLKERSLTSIVVPCLQDTNEWIYQVGQLYYTFEDFDTGEQSDRLGVGVTDIAHSFPGIYRQLSNCQVNSYADSELQSISSDFSRENIQFQHKVFGFLLGDLWVRDYDIWIYNVDYGPLFSVPCDSSGKCVYVDTQQAQYEQLAFSLDKLRTNWQSSSSSLAGVIEFKCKEDSDNAYDTEMRVLGFNPFDPLTIGLVFLISLILYIYGAMFRFR